MENSLGATAFASHVPQQVELAEIERALTRFWRYPGVPEAGGPVTRACMANVVIFCRNADEEQEIVQEIPAIVAQHPSRVLLLVADAQSHADEDRRRREEVEARNHADAIAYQVERQLQELGDRAPANDKARAEQLISEIRQLVKENSSDVARLRQLASDLQQLAHGLASAAYTQAAAGGAGPQTGGTQTSGAGPRPGGAGGDDEVIDAEFKESK